MMRKLTSYVWCYGATPPSDAVEEPGGVVVSYGEDGEPVTVEFLNASVRKLTENGELNVTLQHG